MMQSPASASHPPSPLSVAPKLALNVTTLGLGGLATGIFTGWLTRHLLRWLRWHGASAPQQNATVLAMGYLVYYCAEVYVGVSGVVAVVAFGLFGNSWALFELGSSERMRDLQSFQDTLAFALNGVVFFFAGASSVNFSKPRM